MNVLHAISGKYKIMRFLMPLFNILVLLSLPLLFCTVLPPQLKPPPFFLFPLYTTCILLLAYPEHPQWHLFYFPCFCHYNRETFEDLGLAASNERGHVTFFWAWVTLLSVIF